MSIADRHLYNVLLYNALIFIILGVKKRVLTGESIRRSVAQQVAGDDRPQLGFQEYRRLQ